jgi:hypothetical protein
VVKQKVWNNLYFIPLFALLLFFTNNSVFAQTDEIQLETTIIGEDKIKFNYIAQQILEKIELSKIILSQLQEEKYLEKTEEQKLIDKQREISKQKLQEQIDRMNRNYEPFTPRNSFAKYLTGVDKTYHGIYWDQFNFITEKIKIAKAVQVSIINQGGTYQEAFKEYVRYASMTKVEMIQLTQELNIKYGFADAKVQKQFDKYGKLPRTNS